MASNILINLKEFIWIIFQEYLDILYKSYENAMKQSQKLSDINVAVLCIKFLFHYKILEKFEFNIDKLLLTLNQDSQELID